MTPWVSRRYSGGVTVPVKWPSSALLPCSLVLHANKKLMRGSLGYFPEGSWFPLLKLVVVPVIISPVPKSMSCWQQLF